MADQSHIIVTEGILPAGTWAFVADRFSPFAKETLAKLVRFVQDECMPAEELYHAQVEKGAKRWQVIPPVIEDLKRRAKQLGLWNLFLSKRHYPEWGTDLTNLEYGVMAEVMGRAGHFASEACNCAAPDTGNMEVLAKYGNKEQQEQWLKPLLAGEIRSSFAMTERFVASSDATNIRTSLRQEGDEIVINGHKWWISGAGDPRCAVHLLMGKHDPDNPNRHAQQSMVIVPANAPGVKVVRAMQVFGDDDAPEGHMEVIYENVRVPLKNLLVGWGKGFEIIQGRLGPGRIHHCMRSIGTAERALELMLRRVTDPRKTTFGKMLSEHGTIVADIARCRMEIDAGRLLVLSAANMIDQVGAKGALRDIAYAKVMVPNMALAVLDRAMQAHGAEGICQDTMLAAAWAGLRTLRYADGPDEVHMQQQGKIELRRAPALWERQKQLEAKRDQLFKQYGTPRAHI
ncbi:acyl-CoA dehydrogenase [Tilletiopsis washingtonensis]|uniref:Acyl-CoA dehydrogenase n=1 Tax=Tilletiopsis washingtonensis TaxID=58919 RepID=A0A316ZFS9_9BASI|nr:acyl-CoA dehydrogenase [Tilletiopsis washingtonensis]PWO00601.1 acyl-CoA dehydrogenase [Tilletiopsis washingtonensis]